ncbi:unnamed protein product, partial [Rhizoctonia solani]
WVIRYGTSLANALSRYLNLCTSLGTNSLQEGARANDLVARIDSKLESLHVSMEQQTAQTRSALSKTLNDIAPPVRCLPEEILAKIFACVIYSAQYRITSYKSTDRVICYPVPAPVGKRRSRIEDILGP